MDRLEEIRQHCEDGRLIRRIDVKWLLSEVARLSARAEAAEAERDRAIKQMCRFCKSQDKKAGIKPVCSADCEWRGQEAGKGDSNAEK